MQAAADKETIKDAESGHKGSVGRWLAEISKSREFEDGWRKNAQEAWQAYLAQKKDQDEFNIFWSNIETMRPAIWQKLPNPDVRRRFSDDDPIAKDVAEVTERLLSYAIDNDYYTMDVAARGIIDDYLITGRGVAFVEYAYDAYIERIEVTGVNGSTSIEEQETFDNERVVCNLVPWDRFYVHQAKTWQDVRWVAVEYHLTKDEAKEKLGKDFPKEITYTVIDKKFQNKSDAETPDIYKRVQVFKIWDKQKRKIVYVSPGYTDDVLKEEDDIFDLPGFFPFPRPLYGIQSTTDMIPTAEYALYKKQIKELNNVTRRIDKIIEGLKVRGLYSASLESAVQVSRANDFEYIAAPDSIMDNLDSKIWTMPIEKAVAVLQALYQQRDEVKQVIYEIIGISDILRGASKATETATAQNIKARFGGLRIEERTREVARFFRDLLRIKAHIMAQFEPERIADITGMQVDDEVLFILQQGGLRSYRIDVETDSTVQAATAEKQEQKTELLRGVVEYIQGMAPIVAQGGIDAQAALDLLLNVVRSHDAGRQLEAAVKNLIPRQVENQLAAPGIPTPGQPQAIPQQQLAQALLQ